MTQIKLCGLSRPEDIAAANALKSDFVGFVFAGSRRQVTPEAALRLRHFHARAGSRRMAAIADGAIVGSAIVKQMAQYGSEAPAHVGEFVRRMKQAL